MHESPMHETDVASLLSRPDAGPASAAYLSAAFLIAADQTVYFSRLQPLDYQPETPATRLICGLWARFGSNALVLVRRPIFTLAPITELDRAFVKVSAKRIKPVTPSAILPSERPSLVEIGADERLDTTRLPARRVRSEPEALACLEVLESRIPRGPRLATSARRLSALLVDAGGEVLSAALNTAGHDRTRHAEANLVRSWWQTTRSHLPQGATLYCTLKPCKMCAALIWTAAHEHKNVNVVFARFDPGPLAQDTLLSKNGMERLAKSAGCK